MTDRYAALRAAIPNATPGEWFSVHHGVSQAEGGEQDICRVSCTLGKYEPEQSNRNYIAAANPVTIAALLAERDEMLVVIRQRTEESNKFLNRIEVLEDENKRLRAMQDDDMGPLA